MQKVKDAAVSLFRSIELDLLKAKLAYLFYMGSLGAIYPIFTLWMRSKGLTKPQTGVLFSTRPFMSFVALPLAGLLADRYNLHKKLLVSLCFVSIAGRLIMLMEPWHLWIAFFFMFTELCAGPVGSLLDSGVVELLGESRRGDYGKQRLFGSLGYGATALLIGFVVKALGENFNLYFFWQAGAGLVGLGIFVLLQVNKVNTPAPLWQSFRIVFSNVHAFVFFLLMTMIGCTTGILSSYLMIFLDEIGADKVVMGVATMISCVAEIPFFFFSSHLLRYLGERNMLYIACFGGMVRFTWYTVTTQPWMIVWVESMHGLLYAAAWSAAMSYVYKIAPPGLGATAQGLLAGLYGGLGNGLGALVGGFIYDRWGYIILFRSTAIFLFVAFLMFFFINAFFKNPHIGCDNAAPPSARLTDVELNIQSIPGAEDEIKLDEDPNNSTATPSTNSTSSDTTLESLEH